ncbi:type I secretion system permease/ATPase [Ruegeria atlantica]|uniref:type I secretion system permease/ATPase n=1 Tax=Ruegeria atlantica TaxID=81569 RepID=UPI00147CC984|nr:type I secretion system permease/ATPase [Ruegeria atlantica]
MNPVVSDDLLEARKAGRSFLWAVCMFSVFVNLLMLTGPLFMLQVYDRVLASGSEETLAALFVLVVVLYGLMTVLDYVRSRVLARFGARFQARLDNRVFHAVVKRAVLPKERAAPSAGLNDLESVRAAFASPVMIALFDIPWTPIFVAGIFILHPWLGWLAVFGSVVQIATTLVNNWLTGTKTLAAQNSSRQAQGFAEQVRRSAEIVRGQGMSRSVAERWHGMRDDALEKSIRASDWTGLFSSFGKTFRLFLQSAMLALGAYLVLKGSATGGAMIASSILLGRALAPIQQALGQWGLILQARNGWRSLGDLLATTPEDMERHDLPRPHPNISFVGVSVIAPGAKAPTVRNVSFYLGEGEILGVIGKSGSGKTTLAKTLLGLFPAAAGEVRLGGATLDQYDPDVLGSHIGYLPQSVTLFSGTISENIARMAPEPDQLKVTEAAKRANAHEMILSLPDGYNTVLQGDESQLSGGQKQRIALARAFFGDPVLLLLDEPNSALDNDGTIALNQALRDFKTQGKSAVLMTHRPSAITECDRLLVIEDGQITADGPRDEVLKATIAPVEQSRKPQQMVKMK